MTERAIKAGECRSENFPCVCRHDKDHPLPHQCFECNVDWDDDGNEWIRVTAVMQVLGGNESPLEMRYLNKDVWGVEVPGFGMLIVVRDDDRPNSGVALLTRGPGTAQERPVTRTVNEIRCEMLHKEDRLCVVIKTASR